MARTILIAVTLPDDTTHPHLVQEAVAARVGQVYLVDGAEISLTNPKVAVCSEQAAQHVLDAADVGVGHPSVTDEVAEEAGWAVALLRGDL